MTTANTGTQNDEENEITIHDRTVVSDNDSQTITGIDISKKRSDDKEGQPERKRFVTVTDKETGSVSMEEVDAQQYEVMTSTDRTSTVDAAVSPTAASDDIVERSDVYSMTKEECDVHDNYNHLWAAVTAEFTDEVGNLSWASVSAALISLVGSSSITGGAAAVLVAAITAVGGLAAIVTDTYELTFGASEWDQSLVIHDQAMYSARVAPGYHKEYGELTTISGYVGHPAHD
ncbi:hypothetical protein [Natronorubrum sp. DTA28]|uniref:hypothetical protein n=1 Tax=Natronorubrum sp. DTA28 TaxID=3447019 RepID=UPI003F844C84